MWHAIERSRGRPARNSCNLRFCPFTSNPARDTLIHPDNGAGRREEAAPAKERTMKTVLALIIGFAITGQAQAQTAPAAQHQPRGTATDIANADILATVQTTAAAPVSDQQLRVVSI